MLCGTPSVQVCARVAHPGHSPEINLLQMQPATLHLELGTIRAMPRARLGLGRAWLARVARLTHEPGHDHMGYGWRQAQRRSRTLRRLFCLVALAAAATSYLHAICRGKTCRLECLILMYFVVSSSIHIFPNVTSSPC